MKKMNILALFFALSSFAFAEKPSIDFYKGSLINAKELALKEGKPFMMAFYADWCNPCKWMDKHTYSDKNVANYVNENYIAVKVDIDDFEGHAWKQKYNVEYLPTIILFDGSGRMLGKYEKSISSSKLLNILKDHHKGPKAPKQRTKSKVKKSEPQVVQANNKVNTKRNEPKVDEEGTYRVQIGVYGNANNVFNQVEILKKNFEEPVQVYNNKSSINNKVLYRVMLGKFYSKSEAQYFLTQVKSKGFDGMVKDVSLLPKI